MNLKTKLRNYYFTAIFSVFFALAGFSYNTWRMEITEDNNNTRTAAFEVLIVLAEFEQILYTAHYDKNTVDGSARIGWVKIGLATDLSALISPAVEVKMEMLTGLWSESWSRIENDGDAVDELVSAVTDIRMQIKTILKSLN